MDISDIDGDTIERAGFKDKDFERLFRRLLKAERGLRHRPDAEIKGPVGDYRKDGKRDLVFVRHGLPTKAKTEFTAALTWDELGQTWYSCKGGTSWRRGVLDTDLGQGAYNRHQNDGKTPGPKVKLRPPLGLLQHIEAGGRYVIVVATAEVDDRNVLDQAANLLRFWLEQDGLDVPCTLHQQLAFIDANHIADFISTHHPELSAEQRRALGLEEPEGLKPWEQWTDELNAGRDAPTFEADAARDDVFAAIADESKRIVRIFGAPGVGKTRVVHEGIRRCGKEAMDCTRYSDDLRVNLDIVSHRWLRDGAKPWLVLDEMRSVDVEGVMSLFDANAPKGARLVLVGTADGRSVPVPGQSFSLSPLGEAQSLELIRREARGLAEDQVVAIKALSEGYPWYAVLLARAVSVGEHTLEHGDDEATRWHYGTQRVLAGSPHDWPNVQAWEREAELRGKALLVAMLTRDLELEWDELWDRHHGALSQAIDEPANWHEVKRRGRTCQDRLLLRQSGASATRRYVSPNNLARTILNRFLSGPDPELGPRIRRHAPELRKALYEIAKAVGVKPEIVKKLARGEFEELDRRARQEGVEAIEAYVRHGDMSHTAAREVPEQAASTFAAAIQRLSVDGLESAGNLKVVARWVLGHVVHRKIPEAVFLAVEDALMALARVDNSAFSNNAGGIWASLFLPGLHATHQPWRLRRARLDERLADPDVFVRALAITALERGVEPHEQGLGYAEDDQADGEWPVPGRGAYLEAKGELWERLLRACEDSDLGLADQARTAVARRLRGALGRGLEQAVVQRLALRVASWTPEQRLRLLENIADLRRYDLDDYTEFPELLEALAELERTAAPGDLRERVQAQIGSWSPGPWALDHPERGSLETTLDRALADELLEDPEALSWALEWSSTEAAHRAGALWTALGHVDRRQKARGAVLRALDGGLSPTALGQYLVGVVDGGGAKMGQEIETWLAAQTLQASPKLAQAALWFLVFQSPSEARLERVRELVEGGVMHVGAMRVLTMKGWPEQLEPRGLATLLERLVEAGEVDEVALRFGLALLGRNLDEELHEKVLELLEHALQACLQARTVGSVQMWFVDAGMHLAKAGRVEALSRLLLEALAVNEGAAHNSRVAFDLIERLLLKGYGDALWRSLATSLFDARGSLSSLHLAVQRPLAHVSDEIIMEWVGDDPHRGSAVADLTSPHAEELSPVIHTLLLRFGGEGRVASQLRSRALSTPGVVVGGLEKFENRQIGHARTWQDGAAPPVKAWAHGVEEALAQRIDMREARKHLLARYG